MSFASSFAYHHSTSMADSAVSSRSWWSLCRAEPFRIFFPLGVLVALSGVSLWPLYFSGLHKFYPGIMHARMMIEGFMGAFVIGFLGTAGPRLTESKPFSKGEFWSLLGLYLATVGVHIAECYAIADALFLLLLVTFVGMLFPRFRKSAERPPASFVLVGFGLLSAFLGAALSLAGEMGVGSPAGALIGMDFLNQAFVACCLLGVGGFLLARFLGIPAAPKPADGGQDVRDWRIRAVRSAVIGFVLMASYPIEVFLEVPRVGAALRLGLSAMFLSCELRMFQAAPGKSTVGRWLGVSFFLLLVGFAFPLVWPLQRVAGLHIIFIGAFSLAVLAVGTRVIFGHSGQLARARGATPLFTIAALLMICGMVLRVTGDFFPLKRAKLLDGASHAWLTGMILWACVVLPSVRKADPEEE